MRRLRTILCPIDFDVNSLAALDYARDLACGSEATLYVLHVVTSPGPLLASARSLDDRAREYAHIRLNEIARESLRNVHHRLLLKTGQPAEQIIETVAEVGADLLVMATHGSSGVSRFLVGSATEKVVRLSLCPVLTIRGIAIYKPEHPEVTQ